MKASQPTLTITANLTIIKFSLSYYAAQDFQSLNLEGCLLSLFSSYKIPNYVQFTNFERISLRFTVPDQKQLSVSISSPRKFDYQKSENLKQLSAQTPTTLSCCHGIKLNYIKSPASIRYSLPPFSLFIADQCGAWWKIAP